VRVLVVGFPTWAGGCDDRCEGIGCESSFPAARLAVHLGGALERRRGVWTDAEQVIVGTEAHGSDWTAAIGPGRLAIGHPEAGQVRVFRWTDAEVDPLSEVAVLTGPRGFGGAVAWVDSDLWVAAPDEDLGRGVVRRFPGSPTGRTIEGFADRSVAGVSSGDQFGAVLVRCGDLTGDGLAELAVGAPRFSSVPSDQAAGGCADGPDCPRAFWASLEVPLLGGLAFVLRSEAITEGDGPITPSARDVFVGGAAGDSLGAAIHCDGDLDGDLVPDLVIGAPAAGARDRGEIWIVSGQRFRTPTGRSPRRIEGTLDQGSFGVTPWVTLTARTDRDEPDHLGRWLAQAEVDGDGEPDLIVGAPDWRIVDAVDAGFVSIWTERVDEPRPITLAAGHDDQHRITGSLPYQRSGGELAVGDLNGDGVDDLALPTRARAPRAVRTSR
jgi:hypothetical protein